MDNDFEFIETEDVSLNGLQVYQQDKALIDIQISTAKKYPRNLRKSIENAITVVTLSMDIAKSCTYSLNKGGKLITGPSVNLAKIILQQMGNVRAEQRVVGYDSTHVTCEAVVFDLERNYAIRTQLKRSIVGKSGRFSEDLATIVGNAGNSIALRNATFAVFPAEIIDKVYKAALNKITGDISDENKLTARRIVLFEGFKSTYSNLSISDEDICRSVSRQYVSHITKEDIVVLIGFEESLKSGEITPESLFKPQSITHQFPPKKQDKSDERILILISLCKDKKSLVELLSFCNTIESKTAYDLKLKSFK